MSQACCKSRRVGLHHAVMTKPLATAQYRSRKSEMGRPMPRRFSKPAWWRFARDRRRRYLGQLGGQPSEAQASLIDTLVQLEWSALAAENEGGLQAFRESREHRRLLARLLADFERSLGVPSQPTRAEPGAAEDTARRALNELLKVQREASV
jgi:hypothetical protein